MGAKVSSLALVFISLVFDEQSLTSGLTWIVGGGGDGGSYGGGRLIGGLSS